MERPWPKKGDRLLRVSGDWQTSVPFAPDQLSRDAFIWDGYMTGGAALIDEAQKRPNSRHALIYPILFNYRHGLEVAMKWTIEWYGTLAGVQLDEHDHDLWALWMKCKAILLSVSGSDKVALIAVEQIVNEFQQWDKKATAFRYSRNKNGLTIPLPKRPIDLENMQRVMEAVDNFFKGADGLLSDMLSAAPDQF